MNQDEKLKSLERVHHPYSPSKLQLLEACPNYTSAFTESEAAKTGTLQHDVAETGVDNHALPDEKALAAVECMRYVDERRALLPGCITLKEDYLQVDDREVKSPSGESFFGTTAGYLDIGLVSADGKYAEVIDYKFGQNAVEPVENNLQGMAYMLGIFKLYPNVESCRVTFLLPHRDEIDTHTFFRREFADIYLRILTVVNRAIAAPKDFSSAVAQSGCMFCDHLGRCPKVAELALRVSKKYRPVDFPDSLSTSVFTDPAQIELGLRLAQIVKVWAEAYRSQATAKTIDDPNFIPKGYKLVSMQTRKVEDPHLLARLAKGFLNTPELQAEVDKLFDIPLGALEKLVSFSAVRGQKEATVEEFGKQALEAGALKLGTPYAFLKQSKTASE